MTDDKVDLIRRITEALPSLTGGQIHWIDRAAAVFSEPYMLKSEGQGWFTDETLLNFGEAMRVHHCFSIEPFSKDKFEYVLVAVLKMSGVDASLAPKGNPGHDATIDGTKVSLKTQADKKISSTKIWISKFMELGKGTWGHEVNDIDGMRNRFLDHLKGYDRILTLRALKKSPDWCYELVEIPKSVLEKAKDGILEIKSNSTQNGSKPGYCRVEDDKGQLFCLYFDGGSERKLQVRGLRKDACLVHATWTFHVPTE
jgi:type II restriction enzyme